jgi:dienelactone hydrolase
VARMANRGRPATILTACGVCLTVVCARWAPAQQPERFPSSFRVDRTFDGKPFSYTIESAIRRNGYTLYRLTYPSPVVTALPQNNTVPAEYYVPSGWRPGDARRPAVIAVHILDGNMELVRLTCTMLATHGVPAILFKLPYYGERGGAEGPHAMEADPRMLVEAIGQALEDVRRTVDMLTSRPEVDAQRIGITGISLGGIVAATAAETEPRLSRAMLILAGGDLWAIIHYARETDGLSRMLEKLPAKQRGEIQQAIAAVDPLTNAGKLKARAAAGKILMVNAAEDEVVPRACTEKLAEQLGIRDRVRWLDGLGHYTALASLPKILQDMVEFFGQDLPPGVQPVNAARPTRSPTQLILGLAQETLGFLLTEPANGKCHFADLAVRLKLPNQQAYDGRLMLIRGAQFRFKLECRLPVVDDIAIGQGRYPWMLSSKKTVFKGTKDSAAGGQRSDPLAGVRPEYLARVKMLSGVLGGAMIAPEILDPHARCAAARTAEGYDAIDVTMRGSSRPEARLTLQNDGRTPRSLDVHVDGVDASVSFRAWQMNTVAHEAMFEPPAAQRECEVGAADVLRVFSAWFNFAMESAR